MTHPEHRKPRKSFTAVYGAIAALVTCAVFGAGFIEHFATASEVAALKARQDKLDERIDWIIDTLWEMGVHPTSPNIAPKPPTHVPKDQK